MKTLLSKLKTKEKATIKGLNGANKSKIASLGLRVGKKIEVISRLPLMGPMVIKLGHMKVAIGRKMAEDIVVEK